MLRLSPLLAPLVLLACSACGSSEPWTIPEATGPKVAVFCVDGATFAVIKEMQREQVPNMSALMERGVHMVLDSTLTGGSPVLWATMMTGTESATHGITGWSRPVELGSESPDVPKSPSEREVMIFRSTDRKVPALWNMVSTRGGSVGVIGLLNTLPAEPVEGYVISDRFPISKHAQMGWAPTDEGITFPPHLLQELGPLKRQPNAIGREELKRLGTFTDEEWDMLLHWEQDPENVRGNAFVNLKYAYQSTGTVGDTGLHMLENYPQPNLLLIYLELPDRVQHQFWGFWDPEVVNGPNRNPPERIERFKGIVPGSYEFVDEIIGSFLARLDPDTTVFLISDHGMTRDKHDGWLPEDPINVDSTGIHHRKGLLIAAGPAIQHGTRARDRATQLDIAPTVLAALGLPGSTQFEGGEVLEAILDPAFLAEHPQAEAIDEPPLVRPNVHVPRGMDEDYVDHMQAIGYIGTDGEDN